MFKEMALRLTLVSARQWVNFSGWGMLALAAVFFLGAWTWSRATWFPSLTCNLATTGIAILVINRVVADAERREREQIETYRRHRKELRQMKRRAGRREMLRPETGHPVAASLNLGSELIEVSLNADLAGALEHIRKKQAAYREHADAVGHFCLLFGRFLTYKELGAVESIRRIVKNLAIEVDTESTDDVRKAEITRLMEGLNACALLVGMAFNDQQLLQMQGEFNGKVGRLQRTWDVPGIRKRLREEAKKGAPPSA